MLRDIGKMGLAIVFFFVQCLSHGVMGVLGCVLRMAALLLLDFTQLEDFSMIVFSSC